MRLSINNKKSYFPNKGFTIVELLIVIVVIAILAAITIVAYNGIQQRARDTQRRSDVAAIEKGLKMWTIDNPETPYMTNSSGCGGNTGSGHAWFNYRNGTTYPEAMSSCLKSAGYTSGDIIDPSGGVSCNSGMTTTCFAYMVCTGTQGTYIFAHLESLPDASSEADGSCQGGWDTSYGMNYVVKVN